MNIDWNKDADEQINEKVDGMLERLGLLMEAQVKKNCPVDLDNLRESVAHEVDRTTHTLYVTATGDEGREGEDRKYYATWVDLGHEQWVFGHNTHKIQKPTAFMRRSLYRRYPGF